MKKQILKHYQQMIIFLESVLGLQHEICLFEYKDNNRLVNTICSSSKHRQQQEFLISWLMKVVDKPDSAIHVVNDEHEQKRISVFLIRDEKDSVIGVFCITTDIRKFKDISQQILELVQCEVPTATVNIKEESNISSVRYQIEESITKIVGGPVNQKIKPSLKTKLEVVKYLDEQSVFLYRGAVKEVARQLDCSEASVYRYLNKINQKKIS